MIQLSGAFGGLSCIEAAKHPMYKLESLVALLQLFHTFMTNEQENQTSMIQQSNTDNPRFETSLATPCCNVQPELSHEEQRLPARYCHLVYQPFIP